jgi:hypothetical protein
MKTLKNTLLIALLFLSSQLFAQTGAYQAAMKKGLEQFAAANTPEDFIGAANYFERIANAEPKQWLPVYYSAYANLRAGLLSQDKTQKDEYFDKALAQVDQADGISANNSEIYTLLGYCQYMKMSVDPQSRLELIAETQSSLEKAKQLDPKNPRPYFVQGQNTFYTPEAFGGGKAMAKPILEQAVSKYEQFKAVGEFAPSWGADRAKLLLSQCQ